MFTPATLGDVATKIKVANIGTNAAAVAVPTVLVAAHLLPAAAAGPIGAGIAAAGALIAWAISKSGCGPTCVMATGIVDQLEPQLAANRDEFLAGPKTAANKAAAIANFDYAMEWLRSTQACGSPELGDAGKRCISDRTRGGQWDWYSYYRDPIEAVQVAPDPISQAAALFMGGGASEPSPALLMAAGLLLVGVLL